MSLKSSRCLERQRTDSRMGPGGAGILDNLSSLKDKLSSFGSAAASAYSSDLGTRLRNMLPDADENARPGFPGEKHAILFKKGSNMPSVGNYIGPGTKVLERLKRGDPPRSAVDRAAQAHDIRYMVATDQKQVRDADNRMIDAVARIRKNKEDDPRNIFMAETIMRSKRLAEDLGALDPKKFASLQGAKHLSKEDRMMAGRKLAQLTAEGYGVRPAGRGIRPAGGGLVQEESFMSAASSVNPNMSGLEKMGKVGRGFPAGGKMAVLEQVLEQEPEPREFPGDQLRKIAMEGVRRFRAKDVATATAAALDEMRKSMKKAEGGAFVNYGAFRDKLYSHLKPKKQRKKAAAAKSGGQMDFLTLIKSAAKMAAPTLAKWLGLEKGEYDMVKGKLMPLIDSILNSVASASTTVRPSGSGKMPKPSTSGYRVAARNALGGAWYDDFWDGLRYSVNLGKEVVGAIGDPETKAIAGAVPSLGGPRTYAEVVAAKKDRDNRAQADLDTAEQRKNSRPLTAAEKAGYAQFKKQMSAAVARAQANAK